MTFAGKWTILASGKHGARIAIMEFLMKQWKSRDGILSTVRQTFVWSLGVTVLFFLVYGVGGVPLLRLMTSDASVVEAGRAYLPWLLLMPVIGCPAFTWDGIFMGATASKDLRNSTAWCAVGFFAVWYIGAQDY